MNKKNSLMAILFFLTLILMAFYPGLLRQVSETYEPGRIFYHVMFIKPLLYLSGAYLVMDFITYKAVLHQTRKRALLYMVLGPGAGCLWLLSALFLTASHLLDLSGDFVSYMYWGLQILTLHNTSFIIIGICLCLWNHGQGRHS